MRKMNRVDNADAVLEQIAGVTMEKDTFSITVKDEDKNEIYKNEEEEFSYPRVADLAAALEYFGAKLGDDQKTFLAEALKGDETSAALQKIVDTINDDLKVSAKNRQYQAVFTAKKPMTDESKDNATASIVRNFMKLNNVSDETALTTLQGYGVVPKDYSLEDFRGNRGKR